MTRRRHQTGKLSGRRVPPSDNANQQTGPHLSFPESTNPAATPSHLLFQIGASPDPVTTIGHTFQEQLVLGRSDPETGVTADVDLSPYNAIEKGVSRRHATIISVEDMVYVQDLGSRNGMQLNDIPLDAKELYPLHDGDMLLLGNLQVTVWFVTDE
ncbi:MAG: FHA domain-containing protein [Chloroflexi bacterium]|nr:FHA domain-containing protein [Chloroflexota bacterium]